MRHSSSSFPPPARGALLDLPLAAPGKEVTTPLARGQGILIERIVSFAHATPQGKWYDQEQDEWVMVVQGNAVVEYADAARVRLEAGDWLFIPRHARHRVASTSETCVWLAVHANMRPGEKAREE